MGAILKLAGPALNTDQREGQCMELTPGFGSSAPAHFQFNSHGTSPEQAGVASRRQFRCLILGIPVYLWFAKSPRNI